MSSVINRRATKEYVLQAAKEIRTGGTFTRVSKQFIDQLEYWVEAQLRSYVTDLALVNPDPDKDRPDSYLLTWSVCNRKLMELLKSRVNWVKITKIEPTVLLHLEYRLRSKIRSEISSLPSVGQTIM